MTPIVSATPSDTGTVAVATTEAAPTPEQSATAQAPIVVVQPLDAMKQARRDAANQALIDHAKGVADAAAADALAAKQAEVAKAAEADQIGQLTTKLTEAQTQASTLQERAKMAETLEQASTLAKAGKHYDAMQLLKGATGADMDLAVQELINPGSTPEPAKAKPADADESPREKALREQVEALTKKVADKEANELAMAKEAGRKSIVAQVDKDKAAYPFLSSNETWINAALVSAEEDYGKAVQANKGTDLTQEQKNALIDTALKAAEAKHKSEAENYAKILGLAIKTPTIAVQPKPAAKPTLTYTGTGPGLTPAVAQGKVKTLDELKRARRAN